jgi:fructosamine-3-kinase
LSNLYWIELGRGLANIHKNRSPTFGLNHDNYIGSLKQSNSPTNSWIHFFIHSRINSQLKLAIDKGQLNSSHQQKFEILFKELPNLLPNEKPALLHGDLWSGNVIVDHHGNAVLIDPAVYYGHREMDLAFTRLFGGFNSEFYHSYFETFPLEPGFDNRVDIYNLYPLLVHVNLFGGSYANQVVSILNRFT